MYLELSHTHLPRHTSNQDPWNPEQTNRLLAQCYFLFLRSHGHLQNKSRLVATSTRVDSGVARRATRKRGPGQGEKEEQHGQTRGRQGEKETLHCICLLLTPGIANADSLGRVSILGFFLLKPWAVVCSLHSIAPSFHAQLLFPFVPSSLSSSFRSAYTVQSTDTHTAWGT